MFHFFKKPSTEPEDIAVRCGKRYAKVMGLGTNCRARFHIERVFDRRLWTSGIFDNQITLPDAIIKYVESDFTGLFELGDLEHVSEGNYVINRKTDARHVHEFHGAASTADIAEKYEEYRKRHDYLCGKARRMFRSPEPLFLFISGRVERVDVERIASAIRKTYPALSFRLIPEPADDKEPTFDTDESRWHGNYEAWDRQFARYLPLRRIEREFKKGDNGDKTPIDDLEEIA